MIRGIRYVKDVKIIKKFESQHNIISYFLNIIWVQTSLRLLTKDAATGKE